MRLFCAVIAALSMLLSANSRSAECDDTFHTNGLPDKAHLYHLSVTSESGRPVRITGSVALMGPDNFVAIDGQTPYDLSVCGVNVLLIVSALDTSQKIDFSFAIDGQESTSGTGSTVFAVGEDTPKRGLSFSSNYNIQAKDNLMDSTGRFTAEMKEVRVPTKEEAQMALAAIKEQAEELGQLAIDDLSQENVHKLMFLNAMVEQLMIYIMAKLEDPDQGA